MATYVILTPRCHDSINHFSGVIHTRDSELSQRALKLHCKDRKEPTRETQQRRRTAFKGTAVSLPAPPRGQVFSAKSCPTLYDPVDCSPPGSSVRVISQAGIPKQAAISFSRGSSWPRERAHISSVPCTGRWFSTTEPPGKPHCVACGDFSSPDQGWNSSPLQWKHRVVTTRLPGRSYVL